MRAFFLISLLLAAYGAGAPARAAAPIVVDVAAASAEFPGDLRFRLQAHDAGSRITRAVLAYRFTGDPFTGELVAAITPGDSVSTEARLNTRTHYLPPGVDVTYRWSLDDAAGNHLDSPPQQVRYEDGRFPWQVSADAAHNLRVHWYRGDAAFGQDLRTTGAQALDHLQATLGLTLTLPVEVWVYPDQGSLASALPPNEQEWIGGQAFVENGVVLALIDPAQDAAHEIRRIVPHELSHLVVYQATRNPYNRPPAWLDEGLAINNQAVQDAAMATVLQDAVGRHALLPLRSLQGAFPADPQAALLSYAESAGAVHFLLDRYGGAKVGAVLAAFRGGVTYDEALRAGLGLDTAGVEAAWRAALLGPAPPGAAPAAAASPGAAPGGADVFLLLGGGVTILLVVGALGLWAVVLLRRGRGVRNETRR